jgi:hypothetical protein
MAIIYKKTLKGVEEVALRSSGLQLRLRAYLILVDGNKSDEDIQMLNASLPEVCMVLAALKDEGYVEATSQSNNQSQAQAQAQSQSGTTNFQQTIQQKPQQTNPAPSFANTTSSVDTSARFLEARDNMTREIMQLLGKDAEMVVSKIQRCENGMDLFAMMMGLKKIIGMYANADKAEQFATKFSYVSTL